MSRLHKSVLGIPQGTTGSLVFRVKKGIAFIFTRPIPFMPGTEPADYARRGRFGLSCRFSKVANSISQLKKIWEDHDKQMSSYNLLTSKNYDFITDTAVNPTAVITPDDGLSLSITSAALTAQEIQIEIDALPTKKISSVVETRIRLVALLHLYNPINPEAPAHVFIPVVSEDQAFNKEIATIFNQTMDSQDSVKYALYTNHRLFYAVLTEDADGKVYHYSSTYAVA